MSQKNKVQAVWAFSDEDLVYFGGCGVCLVLVPFALLHMSSLTLFCDTGARPTISLGQHIVTLLGLICISPAWGLQDFACSGDLEGAEQEGISPTCCLEVCWGAADSRQPDLGYSAHAC